MNYKKPISPFSKLPLVRVLFICDGKKKLGETARGMLQAELDRGKGTSRAAVHYRNANEVDPRTLNLYDHIVSFVPVPHVKRWLFSNFERLGGPVFHQWPAKGGKIAPSRICELTSRIKRQVRTRKFAEIFAKAKPK